MSENQQELFIQSPQTRTFQPVNFDELYTENHTLSNNVEDPNPGPSVDILERNEQFERLLTALGSLSRIAGLETIADGGESRRILEDRYDDVDAVVGSASENKREITKEAKQAFARMYGLKDLSASDFAKTEEITTEELKEDAYHSFDQQILSFFGDSKGADNREHMRRWLNYQRKIFSEKRTRKPTVSLPIPPKVSVISKNETEEDKVNRPKSLAERRELETIAKIEALKGHRIAGPSSRNQAKILKIADDPYNSVIVQGSNGSARFVVPNKYAKAAAKALDNGANESVIRNFIGDSPVMSAKIASKKTGRARPVVRF